MDSVHARARCRLVPVEAVRSVAYLVVGFTIIALNERGRRATQRALALAHVARQRQPALEADLHRAREPHAPEHEFGPIAGTLADGVVVSDSHERISRLLSPRRPASQDGDAPGLRERVEELETLMNLVPVPIYVAHDAECRQVTANRAAVDLLAPPPQAQSASEPLHPYTHRVFQRGRELGPREMPIQRAAANGIETRGEEYEIVFEDGSVKHIFGYASPLFAANGTIRGSFAAFIDITEREQAEDALRESEQRFRVLADSAPVMIWVSGRDGRCTYFNRTWLEFTGRTLADEIAADAMSAVHVDDQARVAAALRTHIDRREGFSLEYRMRRQDGEYRWVLNVGSPATMRMASSSATSDPAPTSATTSSASSAWSVWTVRKTSSSQRLHTNCAIRSHRFATPCTFSHPMAWMRQPCAGHGK